MKHYLTFFMLFGFAVSFLSCQKDEDEIPNPPYNPNYEGIRSDGAKISDINLYCLEKDVMSKGGSGVWFNYYPKIKTINDYANIQLLIMINDGNPLRKLDSEEENREIERMVKEYELAKTSFFMEAIHKYVDTHKQQGNAYWSYFYSACVNGEVNITCDKTLFSEPPGTNLSKYFNIIAESHCIPVGLETPTLNYGFEDELPELMNDYLPNGVWLQPKYGLLFHSLPSEKYDSLNFHLTIPMTIENRWEYWISVYRGTPLDSKYIDRTFEADCLIKFKWDD